MMYEKEFEITRGQFTHHGLLSDTSLYVLSVVSTENLVSKKGEYKTPIG